MHLILSYWLPFLYMWIVYGRPVTGCVLGMVLFFLVSCLDSRIETGEWLFIWRNLYSSIVKGKSL